MSKYFYRIFTIIDLHFGAMQPCSSGLGMTLEASDFRSVRRLVAYSTKSEIVPFVKVVIEKVDDRNAERIMRTEILDRFVIKSLPTDVPVIS